MLKRLIAVAIFGLLVYLGYLATGEFRQGQKFLDGKFYDKALAQWSPLANGENKLPVITTVFGLFDYETRSQQKVGSIYMHRDDGKTNVPEAIKFFNRAAANGDEISQFTLAQEYSNSIAPDPKGKIREAHFEKDMVIAHMWATVALEQKTKKSRKYQKYIKMYEQEMSADDITKAKSLAKVCGESSFQNCGY
jgi:TPR repeat protein